MRADAIPAEGPAGSDPDLTGAYLDAAGVERAVVTGGAATVRAAAQPDRRYAAALTSAYNDWLLEEWLPTDDRLRGSISVAPVAPEAAAEEIRRLADHPDVVQVAMGAGTQIPLGDRRYWPIYEAASEAGLPVAIRAGAEGYGVAHPNTGAGYPSTRLEARSVVPGNFMGQLLNLLLEGPFVEYPDLRVVLVDCGYGWLPHFLWRIDKVWKGVTEDFPWVERPPSEYVRERVRIVTGTVDEPRNPADRDLLLEMLYAEETLCFGSGYPHWASPAPDDLPPDPDLDPERARAIFSGTARDLYGF